MHKTRHAFIFFAPALLLAQTQFTAAAPQQMAAPQVRERFITPPLQFAPQATPQFNEPGAQYVPQVTNPLDQSTLPSGPNGPNALGIK